jgi:hypothetical protein
VAELATIHILWSPQTGPIAAYHDIIIAAAHARTMLGIEVATLAVSEQMPAIAKADLATYFDETFEGDTPVDDTGDGVPELIDTHVVDVDDIE